MQESQKGQEKLVSPQLEVTALPSPPGRLPISPGPFLGSISTPLPVQGVGPVA